MWQIRPSDNYLSLHNARLPFWTQTFHEVLCVGLARSDISYLSAPPGRWRWKWLRMDPQLFERNAQWLPPKKGREVREKRGRNPNPHRPPAMMILVALAGPSALLQKLLCWESIKDPPDLLVTVCAKVKWIVLPQGNWDVIHPTCVIVSLKLSQNPLVELGRSTMAIPLANAQFQCLFFWQEIFSVALRIGSQNTRMVAYGVWSHITLIKKGTALSNWNSNIIQAL